MSPQLSLSSSLAGEKVCYRAGAVCPRMWDISGERKRGRHPPVWRTAFSPSASGWAQVASGLPQGGLYCDTLSQSSR